MNNSKKIQILFTDADRELLQPILEQLRAKGLRVSEAKDSLKKNDIVLAVLSGNFYADGEKINQLLNLIGAGAENVLPLQLDAAPVPDTLKNALYARNIIPASGRDAAHTAERIGAALPQRKSRLPLILSAAGVILLAVVGLLIWRSAQSREAVPAMAVEEITVPVSLGLTEDDLAAIEDVVIVGDYFGYFTDADFREAGENWLNVDWVAYRSFDDGTPIWISKEDGHTYAMTHYDDLRFLELMPNLRFLELVNVEAEAAVLPNLSSASILEGVALSDCNIDSLDWLAGARMRSFDFHNTQVTDYTPLTSCERLEDVNIDLYLMEAADFSAFAPPELQTIWISNGQNLRGGLDLAAVSECTELRECRLDADLPLTDLSFLTGAAKLESLYIYDLHALRDISALSGMKNLKELEIQFCERLTDYTPIASCTALERIHLQCDYNPNALRDVSFLADLPKLSDIGLYSANLRNLDFLEGIAVHQSTISLGFAGQIQDYSGLAYIKRYESLHLNPRRNDGSNFGDLAAVLPYLEGATVKNLHLHDCGGIDLSLLPETTESLEIWYGDLRDLSTLPAWSVQGLQLYDCQYLTSLDGIENLPTYARTGALNVEIVGCPRLMDWSAIENVSLSSLRLEGVYSLPVFDGIDFGSLRLESVEGLDDLHILDKLSDGHKYNSIELVGLDAISDLSPLRRLRISHLDVPPQLAEQAGELVEDGIIDNYDVSYPDGSWQPFEGTVELLSLDELETLPKSLLKRVEVLAIAGDEIIDLNRYEIRENWNAMNWEDEAPQPGLLLYNRETEEETPLELGPVTDLSIFSELMGVKELFLYAQPLETLNGVQVLGNLSKLELVLAPNLTDASAAFALPELETLRLRDSAVSSIQGVQNLQHLRYLDIFHTQVSDLSPLGFCDFSEAYAQGGFQLDAADLPCEDFSPLGSIREYSGLCLNNMDARAYVPCLSASEIDWFGSTSAGFDDAVFARFIAEHPTLTYLDIPWNPEITDLTPLLALERLEYVKLSVDMEDALQSLEGQSYGFQLEIEG